jgi:hypothetical protein
MKLNLLVFPCLLALFAGFGCKPQNSSQTSNPPSTPERVTASAPGGGLTTAPPFAGGRKTSFQEVTAQLDTGGSLFLYLATDQWLATLSTNISQLREVVLGLPGTQGQNGDQIEHVFDLISQLVQTSGVQDVSGVGVSGAQVAPGLFRNKFVAHHPNGAGKGFLWTMFGAAPHPMTGQDMLPPTTALAMFGDLDVALLWQVLQKELADSGMPQAAEVARSFPQLFEKQTQIPWEPLLASLGGEIGVVLTLDEARKISLPTGPGGQIELSAPGLLVAVKVKNDLLFDKISALLQANPKTVRSEEKGLKMCSMPLGLPLPIPLQPTVASSGDYFFFASTPDLVQTVQAVRKGKAPGLKSSAQFQSLTKYLPAEGNQFTYVSPAFAQTLRDVQAQAMRSSGLPAEPMAALQRIMAGAGPSFSLSVGGITPTGWQTTSVGNRDSAAAVLMLPAVAATAVGAGMLLPALAKAKSKAQTINSVNQMKQLGLATRMYANDHGDKFPTAATWCDDLTPFLGGTKVYKAPNDPGPGQCSYAYNAKLSGLDESKVNPQTVLFFEAESGWNRSGGAETLLPNPRSQGLYVVGFADGSVQQIQVSRAGTLRWDP